MLSEMKRNRVARALRLLAAADFNWEYVRDDEPILIFKQFDMAVHPLRQMELAAEVVDEYLLIAYDDAYADKGHFFPSLADAEEMAVDYQETGWTVKVYNLDLPDTAEPFTYAATYQWVRGEMQALPLGNLMWFVRTSDERWATYGPHFLNEQLAVKWHHENAELGRTYRLYKIKSPGFVIENEGQSLDFLRFSAEETMQLTV